LERRIGKHHAARQGIGEEDSGENFRQQR
jgi:hypothetical protein